MEQADRDESTKVIRDGLRHEMTRDMDNPGKKWRRCGVIRGGQAVAHDISAMLCRILQLFQLADSRSDKESRDQCGGEIRATALDSSVAMKQSSCECGNEGQWHDSTTHKLAHPLP